MVQRSESRLAVRVERVFAQLVPVPGLIPNQAQLAATGYAVVLVQERGTLAVVPLDALSGLDVPDAGNDDGKLYGFVHESALLQPKGGIL